ncbi:neoverrucotoxin subunit alpha-like [Chaetodon auriga]|uniref:neoverrucotoxin subunit alpha-like n=1 Tax=Chaetodon auriga TaxID=39042 RepID=UPI004032ADE5
MSSDTLIMAALGRPFSLGMLYDARGEKLIPGFSLFSDEILQQYASSNPQRSSEFQITASDSIEAKSSVMDIEASVGVSLLGGLIEIAGSAKYLNDTKKYQNQSRVALKYKATTTYKQFTAPPGTVKVEHSALTEKGLATHVVTGILYGASAFFVFDSKKLEDENLQEIEGRMEAMIKKIPLISIEGSCSIELTDEEKSLATNLSCKFHGDFVLDSLPTTFEDAVRTYQELPQLLGEDGADAIPVKVWLVPLSKFSSETDLLVREISISRVRNIQNNLEELYQLRRRCNEAIDDKIVRQFPLLHDRISIFQDLFQDYILTLQQTIRKKLPLIRGGIEDERSLEEITASRARSPFSNDNVSMWLDVIQTEISVLKACVGVMEGARIKFVSDLTELDREVLSAHVKHALCFVFTSLGCNDPYLKMWSDFLDSSNPEITQDVAPSSEDLWCFSTRAIIRMKQKAQAFSEFANNLKNSRNVSFLVAAFANEKYQGSSIYYYQEGRLVTEDFTFPRMPSVEDVKDRRDLLWYACDLTFEPNSANYYLTLSNDNRNVESGKRQGYRNHPERFDCLQQVFCRERLTGRHYWEVEWIGYVRAGVSYVATGRKGTSQDSIIGQNWSSWALDHDPGKGYSAKHDNTNDSVTVSSPGFKRLGVYLDWRTGTLSYYMVSSNEVHHIYTFHCKFTEPVYAAFRLGADRDHGQVRLL